MNRESKAWAHAAMWAFVALLWSIKAGSVVGIVFGSVGLATMVALAVLTRSIDRTTKGSRT